MGWDAQVSTPGRVQRIRFDPAERSISDLSRPMRPPWKAWRQCGDSRAGERVCGSQGSIQRKGAHLLS